MLSASRPRLARRLDNSKSSVRTSKLLEAIIVTQSVKPTIGYNGVLVASVEGTYTSNDVDTKLNSASEIAACSATGNCRARLSTSVRMFGVVTRRANRERIRNINA